MVSVCRKQDYDGKLVLDELGPPGTLLRVQSVSDNEHEAVVQLPNGQTALLSNYVEPLQWAIGDVLLWSDTAGGQSFHKVWDAAWRDETWVGIVKLKLGDRTVVDVSGRLRIVENNEVDVHVGNTVEGKEAFGLLRVLDEQPIRYLDVPEVGGEAADFIVGATASTFDDFGGSEHLIARARELVEYPLKYGEALRQIGARPIKGVLFSGPPGTGKTMLARIIAGEAKATFYQISGPEIFSKWYGESEKILRAIFESASRNDRSIIFFDEIDSIAGQRSDEAHEASKRVVAQLLTLMDGFTGEDNIVVIAATNRPQDVDLALRRPGRFDWELTFSKPTSVDRRKILEASSKGISIAEPLPHERVAVATDGWSAADLVAIWSEAALLAVADGRDSVMAADYLGGFDRVMLQRQQVVAVTAGSR